MTLVTCTPYAVNTHRLLVRGRRVEYTGEEKSKTDSPASACCNGQKTGRCMALVPVYDGRRTRPHRGHPRRRQNLHGSCLCPCHEPDPEPCPVHPGHSPIRHHRYFHVHKRKGYLRIPARCSYVQPVPCR